MNDIDSILSEAYAGTGIRRPQYAAPRQQPLSLSPEEESTLLGQIGSAALSGLETVGAVLDLPGSMARDLMAWQNPFDQLLSPMSFENRATGREVLTNLFGAAPNDPNAWEAMDFAGAGVELLADPLLLFTPFKATKAGQIAKKAGVAKHTSAVASRKAGEEVGGILGGMKTTLRDILNDTELREGADEMLRKMQSAAGGADQLDSLMDMPLRGAMGDAFGFGNAYGSDWKIPQYIAGGLDAVGRYVDRSPVGRAWNALFDPAVKDTYRAGTQQASRVLRDLQDDARPGALSKSYRLYDDLDSIIKDPINPMAPDDLNKLFDRASEVGPEFFEAITRQGAGIPGGVPLFGDTVEAMDIFNRMTADQQQKFSTAVNRAISEKDELYEGFRAIGKKAPEHMDQFTEHFPRYRSGAWRGTKQQIFDTSFKSTIRRNKLLKDIPTGKSAIERMAADPDLIGNDRLPLFEAAHKLQAEYGIQDGDQAMQLAGMWAKQHPDNLGKRFYESGPKSFEQYMTQGTEALVASKEALKYIGDNLQVLPTRVPKGSGLSSVSDVLLNMGYTYGDQVSNESLQTIVDYLGRTKGITLNPEQVRWAYIPTQQAEELTKWIKGFEMPEAVKPVAQAIAAFNSLYKPAQTTGWFAHHARNRGSGAFTNYVAGMLDPSVSSATDTLVRTGKPIAGAENWPSVQRILAERGMDATAENADKILKEFSYTNEILPRRGAELNEATNFISDEMATSIPGAAPISPKKSGWGYIAQKMWEWFPKSLKEANPTGTRGFIGQTETTFAPFKAGEDLSYYTEAMNRLEAFFSLLKQGWDFQAAAAKVKAAHVDYSARGFSNFENAIMTQLVPFYRFTRKMVPYTLRELAENPAGRMAKTIELANQGRGKDASTPEHVAAGASVPLGTLEDGSKRYISGFGTMFEDALQFAGPDLRGVGLEALSRLSPLIKAPIEYATGETFFQRGNAGGRDLEDADPLLGRIAANLTGETMPYRYPGSELIELAASNLPGSRALSTLRTMTDQRKWDAAGLMNLLTGVRVTDVSPAAQEGVLRDRAADLAKSLGARDFTKTYVPEEMIPRMNPEQQLQVQQIMALNAMLDRARRERKKAKESQAAK